MTPLKVGGIIEVCSSYYLHSSRCGEKGGCNSTQYSGTLLDSRAISSSRFCELAFLILNDWLFLNNVSRKVGGTIIRSMQ